MSSQNSNTTFFLDEDGELSWADRAAIRNQVGPDGWTSLEIASARKVLPIWSARYPASRITTLLEETERCLSSHANRGTVDRLAEDFQVALLDQMAEVGLTDLVFAPIYAGWAALQAARSISGVQVVKPEEELDPEDMSASFHASLAWAGSAAWERVEGSSVRRAEFWTWWLDEAAKASAGQSTP